MPGKRPPRLLVITYHFPPDNSVGGLRWWGFSRYLLRQGWRVRVLSAQGAPGEPLEGDFEVRSVPPVVTLDHKYRSWRRGQSSSKKSGVPDGSGETPSGPNDEARRFLPVRLLRRFRREVGALTAFPDVGRGWIRPAARAARELMDTFDPDVVVSSGPPHSVHIVARRASRKGRARWFMDFRDPWPDAQGSTPFTTWLHQLLETRCLNRAGRALTTTPELQALLQERYPEAKVHWLSNGVDPADLPSGEEVRPQDGFVLSHVGTVYWKRDPVPVLEGMKRFLERVPDARSDLRLVLVGRVGPEHVSAIEEARRNGLQSNVSLRGWMPREEALEILSSSSVAVVLAQNQGLMVPAKIYESVGLGIPTLAITEPGSATWAAARRLGAEVGNPSEPADIANAIQRLWDHRGQRREVPTEVGYDHLAQVADALFRAVDEES